MPERDEQARPNAPTKVEWAYRYGPAHYRLCVNEADARARVEAMNDPLTVVVRRTVTVTEWEVVDD